MSYKEFSIESVISPKSVRQESIKMKGLGRLKSAYSDQSRSTENFVQNAITDIGVADRNIMFAHATTFAFEDRFNTAVKIGMSINKAKKESVEGFQHVDYLNPLEYAIEGKVGDFFKNVWNAIISALKRLITAIGNFIVWIRNKVGDAGTKAEIKDYKFYKDNRSAINKAAAADGVGKMQFNSLGWKVNGNYFGKLITKALGGYTKAVGDSKLSSFTSTMIQNVEKMDKGDSVSSQDPRAFQLFKDTSQKLTEEIEKMTQATDKLYYETMNSIFGTSLTDKGQNLSPKTMILATLVGGDEKVKKITCGEMKTLSADFSVLSEEWLTQNVKDNVSVAAKAQKDFAKFTKEVERLAKKFDKENNAVAKEENKSDPSTVVKSKIASKASQFCTARTRLNSFMTTMQLQLQSFAFRYRKSAHIALKQYIKAYKKTTKTEKAEESFSFEHFMF